MKNLRQRLKSLNERLNAPIKRNSKGMALLQAMFLVMLITFIVNQVNFESTVEYSLNSQALHRVRAYQAAKAGVELSLLRINLYNKALNEFGSKLGDQVQMLAMIYDRPFLWPMQIPADMSSIDSDALTKLTKASYMESSYATQIHPMDLLNINDLDSPSENQRERIKNMLLAQLNAKAEADPEWFDRNRNIPFEEVVNNIKDWIDADRESGNGGDEGAIYGRLRELDPDNRDTFPPNRFFRTMEEIRMVPGVTDEIFDAIQPGFSVFGPLGINPNLADEGAIKSLHKTITNEIAQKILARREDPNQGGPFKDAEDFFNFASREGARITEEEQQKIPLRFTNPCSFRIESSGSSGKTVISITAITYDVVCAQAEVSKGLQSESQKKSGGGGGDSGDSTKGGSSPKQELPKGPPRIVYWNER